MIDFEKRPLEDVIEEQGFTLEAYLRGQNPYYLTVCPFHNDTNPSLHISVRLQRYKCWSCGAHGDVIQFVKDYLNVPFREAKTIATSPLSADTALARQLDKHNENDPDLQLLQLRAAKIFDRPRLLIFQKAQAILAQFDAMLVMGDWYGAEQLLRRYDL